MERSSWVRSSRDRSSQNRPSWDRSSRDKSSREILCQDSQIGTTEVGTVEYFDSSWNLENLELECGPAQPDLLIVIFKIEHIFTYRKINGYA